MPCGVHEYVQSAELLDAAAHAVGDGLLVADVDCGHAESPCRACCLGQFRCPREAVLGHVGCHDGAAFLEQAEGGGLSDARCGSGHQDPPVVEAIHDLCSSCVCRIRSHWPMTYLTVGPAVHPPSTASSAPVTYVDASDSRNPTAPAISSGTPTRAMGVFG